MVLEEAPQAFQDVQGFGLAGFTHVNFLETAGKRTVPIEGKLRVLERGGADAAQLTRRQRGFE